MQKKTLPIGSRENVHNSWRFLRLLLDTFFRSLRRPTLRALHQMEIPLYLLLGQRLLFLPQDIAPV